VGYVAVPGTTSLGRKVAYFFGAIVLTLLFQGTTIILGPAGVFLNVLTPFPAALLQMLAGFPVSIVAVFASASILSMVGHPALGPAYLLQFGLLSLILPCLLRRGVFWDRAVLGTLAVVLASIAIFAAAYAFDKGISAGSLVTDYVQAEVETAVTVYSQADIPPENADEFRQVITQTADFLLKFWPALMVAFAGALTLLTLFLLSVALGRKMLMPGVPFHLWKTPENFVWFLIPAGFGAAFLEGMYQTVALNILAVLLPVYFLQGVAIMAFFFRKKGISPFLRGVGYVLAFFFNPLPLLVTGLGVFDLWGDFRKPRIKEQ